MSAILRVAAVDVVAPVGQAAVVAEDPVDLVVEAAVPAVALAVVAETASVVLPVAAVVDLAVVVSVTLAALPNVVLAAMLNAVPDVDLPAEAVDPVPSVALLVAVVAPAVVAINTDESC